MPRSYGGATRVGRQGLEVQLKKNRQYIENLKKVIGAVGKKAYGEFVASVLDNVVRETVKDSGRAAANWNLSFGSVAMTASWDPKAYKQTYNGVASIGDRGDKGSGASEAIAYYKGFHYGYSEYKREMELKKDGRIYQALKIGQPGTPPTIYLYNPIFDVQYGSYPDNAFKSALRGGAQTVGADAIDPITGRNIASRLPRLIRETAMEYKFPLTYKR